MQTPHTKICKEPEQPEEEVVSSHWCTPQESQSPERIVRQVHQPPRLRLLRLGYGLQPALELRVLHQDVAVDPEEASKERLDGLKVAVGVEPCGEGGEEGGEVGEGGEGPKLEVGRGGRKGFEVLEERLIWRVASGAVNSRRRREKKKNKR